MAGVRGGDGRGLVAGGLPARIGRARFVTVFAVAIVACLVLSSSAFAVVSHPLLSSFGGGGTPNGVRWEAFDSLAVDNSAGGSAGDVYVADDTNSEAKPNTAVDKFSPAPSSGFLCQITGAPGSLSAPLTECDFESPARPGTLVGAIGSAAGVAVDSSTGAVYVADRANGMVLKFSPAGVYESEIMGLSSPSAVAVDHVTGDVYIVDRGDNTVKRFDPLSSLLTTFATETAGGPFAELEGVAVDNSPGASAGDVYVSDRGDAVVDKFNAAGVYQSQLTGTPEGSFGSAGATNLKLAIDPSEGALYVSVSSQGVVDQFDASGVFQGQLTTGSSMRPSGVAVAASGDVYVIDVGTATFFIVDVFGPGVVIPGVTTGQATEIQPTAAKLEGSVNPAGFQLTGCWFEYVTDAAFKENGFSSALTAACSPPAASIPADSSDHTVTATVSGLDAGTSYHVRLQASNANCAACSNFGADVPFETLPRPKIDSATVTSLTEETGVLNAKINPEGRETHWHFEYDTTPYAPGQAPHGTRVPATEGEDPAIPAGSTDVFVSGPIGELHPDKTYHWRVIASNPNGTTSSSDHTFIYPTTGERLPDSRAYEMVTPPQKNGALIGSVLFGQLPDIAASGTRVMASSVQCFADAASCNAQEANGIGSPYAFTRTGTGWVATALSPPATALSRAVPWEYSAQAGTALFNAPTEPFGEEDFYGHESDGSFVHIGPVTPPAAGPSVDETPGRLGGHSQAVSKDLSHVVWETTEGEGSWPFDGTSGGFTVYEYAGVGNTQPLLVGVTGGYEEGKNNNLISTCGTRLGGVVAGLPPGEMSADGRTVYFTTAGEAGCVGSGVNKGIPVPVAELFARVNSEGADARTVAISEPRALEVPHAAGENLDCVSAACVKSTESPVPPVTNTNWRGAQFKGASADGSKVFFESPQQLTDQASEDPNKGDSATINACPVAHDSGCNLYLYDFSNPLGHQLVDVSAGDTSGGGPRVQGTMAISEDGSHVYFVAKGVLSSNVNAIGRSAQDGANNLYVYERDEAHPGGAVVFIAALPNADSEEWKQGTGAPANVTPEGRYLVFMSHGRLTADDTSVSGAFQVFRYDAQDGGLVRISVGNDGFNDNGNRSATTPCGGVRCSEDALIAFGTTRPDLTMSDDGSYVFFQSPVGLAPGALDDVEIAKDGSGNPVYAENVYEWHAGHVYLLSDGQDVSVDGGQTAHCADSESSVCLLGSDASGSNVFFSTADKLVGTDTDTALDYYDARICTVASPCIKTATPSLPPCLGEQCHGIPAAQLGAPSGGSLSFNGQGNIAPVPVVKTVTKKAVKCKRGFVKNKKAKCVRSPKRKRSKVKKFAHTNRRLGR
jgi:hypothetical protein